VLSVLCSETFIRENSFITDRNDREVVTVLTSEICLRVRLWIVQAVTRQNKCRSKRK